MIQYQYYCLGLPLMALPQNRRTIPPPPATSPLQSYTAAYSYFWSESTNPLVIVLSLVILLLPSIAPYSYWWSESVNCVPYLCLDLSHYPKPRSLANPLTQNFLDPHQRTPIINDKHEDPISSLSAPTRSRRTLPLPVQLHLYSSVVLPTPTSSRDQQTH